MTAEVAVMSRMGVALAADSAVSIGSLARKIYTSAEKLFQLSEVAPVGILIYGNAEHISLPWEVIIKAYRRKLGKTIHKKLTEYSNDFIAFLRSNPDLFPDPHRRAAACRLMAGLFREIREEWRKSLQDKQESKKRAGGDLTNADAKTSVIEVLDSVASRIRAVDEVVGLTPEARSWAENCAREEFAKVYAATFGNTPRPPGVDDTLVTLAAAYLTRQAFTNSRSGIVIAGYGDDEYLPSLAAFEVEECVHDLPRLGPVKTEIIDGVDRNAVIQPYAQQDQVDNFMWGIDSNMLTFMEESVHRMTVAVIDLMLSKVADADVGLADALREPVKRDVGGSLNDLFNSWTSHQADYYIPVRDVVGVLPKDELAAMAEAFVNLTKFRRRVTPVAETVSGPVDVAVITKGDGFVWVRRKHYFPPEINPRVMARFYRPGENS